MPFNWNMFSIQGKGFPDVATRVLVRLLWKFLGVPVLALVDADPHGIEIMCVYRFGSLVSGTGT
jgi:meiotic recombination protein SPO11